jgi:GGDEF domain-containing protein
VAAPIWIVSAFTYIAATTLAGYLLLNEQTDGLFPLNLLAQGVLFLPLSLSLENPPLVAWGVAAVLATAVIALAARSAIESTSSGAPSSVDRELLRKAAIEISVEKCPLPAAFADPAGTVIRANESFRKAFGLEEEELSQLSLEGVLPKDDSIVSLAEGEFRVLRKANGTGTFLCLVPEPKQPQSVSPEARPVLSIMEPVTGLYTEVYLGIRAPEELARAGRYRRWLSALLIRFEAKPRSEFSLAPDEGEKIRQTFAAEIRRTVRTVDLPFRAGPTRYLVLLPETSQSDAKTVLVRIRALPKEIFDETILRAFDPVVDPMEFPTFFKELEKTLDKLETS